ncbi:peptidase S41 [Rhodoferax lacus]|uniref:Peptidase S41 n=1 Tax=Rhodoferax lacus TaxID=2184758 RepID=A0A3E1RE29_9BURK|nr:S41 family peptidase [Rhodoferax lacus]RFO97624.1 peptidase S41 [Rhodoferax lacus]
MKTSLNRAFGQRTASSARMAALCVAMLLAACGGGGGGNSAPPLATAFAPSAQLAHLCANPRPGTADRQGTVDQEKAYLRSFVDETYLWYRDVPAVNAASYTTPQAYFNVLKTNATTATGALVDQFHWSQTTQSWNDTSAGISEDYGILWADLVNTIPRNWVVAEVAPGSPAAVAGVKRGDRIISVDGVDFATSNTSAGVAILNEGLFPRTLAPHVLVFSDNLVTSLAAGTYSIPSVQNVKTLATANGTVGYFVFDTHIAKSEQELIAAINQLKTDQVSDLVIDMRYNGGGLLYIADGLASMIADPASTAGKAFETLIYNDKLGARSTTFPFYDLDSNGQLLPHLNLSRVTLLVTRDTASASESVINSLRGVGVTVHLMGSTTRGKPYGFVPQDNCGYTYFAIQFKGVNNAGFGDYADGFRPTCAAADDFNHGRGDPLETMLSTALHYRLTGACPAVASAPAGPSAQAFRGTPFEPNVPTVVQPGVRALRILTDRP